MVNHMFFFYMMLTVAVFVVQFNILFYIVFFSSLACKHAYEINLLNWIDFKLHELSSNVPPKQKFSYSNYAYLYLQVIPSFATTLQNFSFGSNNVAGSGKVVSIFCRCQFRPFFLQDQKVATKNVMNRGIWILRRNFPRHFARQ